MEATVSTKEIILQKSAELFNSLGFEACSLSDIMEATGLKKGGIYNYFRNKEEIAIEAFNYSFQLVLARFRERLDKDDSSWNKLNSVIEVLESFYENPVLVGGCPIFNTLIDRSHKQPKLKEKGREAMGMLIDYVRIKIDEGIECGEFESVQDPNNLACMVVMSMEGGVVLSRAFEDSSYVEIAARQSKNLLNNQLVKC